MSQYSSPPIFSTKVAPYTVSFLQAEEFHLLKKEIFIEHVYFFETNQPRPRIIDAGAHIGLATLYFKKLFPSAEITVIEPLPQNIQLLEHNIWQNGLSNVKVIPAALWPGSNQVEFHFDRTQTEWFSTASTSAGAWNGQQQTTSLMVSALPLSSLLTQSIDFLKLDIEGSEQAVLEEASDRLYRIKEMIIEFHPVSHQSLSKLIALLERKGFTTQLWEKGKEVSLSQAHGLVYLHAKQNH